MEIRIVITDGGASGASPASISVESGSSGSGWTYCAGAGWRDRWRSRPFGGNNRFRRNTASICWAAIKCAGRVHKRGRW